jgi:hypothetical protein
MTDHSSFVPSCLIIFGLMIPSSFADEAKSACPSGPLGVVTVDGTEGKTYFATAFVGLVAAAGAVDLDEGKRDALLSARLLLKKDNRVPHTKNGLIYGVKENNICVVAERVYATVSVSERSARQANSLKDEMLLSLQKHPELAPQIWSVA